MVVVKPKDRKDDHHNCSLSLSLSHLREILLSHSCATMSECVSDKYKGSLSIYIFCSLNFHFNMSAPLKNYLLGPKSLGESTNPSGAPQLWVLCPPLNKEG